MSKLTVVICAATFFTWAMAGTLRMSERSTTQWDMRDAAEIIGRCGQSVQKRMFVLGPQSLDKHSDLLDEYEKNITDTIEKTRSEVEEIFKENVQPNSHMENCRNFLDSWRTTGRDLTEDSFMTIMLDFMQLLELIGVVPELSRQKQEQLRTVDFHGDTFGNNVSVQGFVSEFCRYTNSLGDEYVAFINGTRPRNVLFSNPRYTKFLLNAHEIAGKTRSCVTSLKATEKEKISVIMA